MEAGLLDNSTIPLFQSRSFFGRDTDLLRDPDQVGKRSCLHFFHNPGAVDFAVRKQGQFKETLGIGLVWKFM